MSNNIIEYKNEFSEIKKESNSLFKKYWSVTLNPQSDHLKTPIPNLKSSHRVHEKYLMKLEGIENLKNVVPKLPALPDSNSRSDFFKGCPENIYSVDAMLIFQFEVEIDIFKNNSAKNAPIDMELLDSCRKSYVPLFYV